MLALERVDAASEARLTELNQTRELAQFKYLLFSTHGYLSTAEPALSAAMFFYAAFVMSFRYANFYRRETRWKIAVETLAMPLSIPGDRLAILTNGGGVGVLATDALLDLGGRLAECEPGAARRSHQQQRGVDAARAVAVEQHAERQLEQREGEEVDAGEQPEARGREAQLARDLRPDDRVDRAVDVGNEIPRQERQGDAGKGV